MILEKKQTVLMAVFNPIEFDGRVKRAAESLNKSFRVILFCPSCHKSFTNDLPSEIRLKRSWFLEEVFNFVHSSIFFWLQFLILACKFRPNIIYSHDFYLSLTELVAAKLIKAKSVYDAHEFIILEQKQRHSVREQFFYWCERFSIPRYDLVIAANSERAELMRIHFTLEALPTSIRNVSKPTIGMIDCSHIVEKYPLLKRDNDESFIVYMGDVSLKRGLATVIDSLRYLPNTISLVIIGNGPDMDQLKEISVTINRRKNGSGSWVLCHSYGYKMR